MSGNKSKASAKASAKTNLILLHGFRGGALGLEKVASFFDKKDFNVYVPNLPPAGDEWLTEYSPRLYARFLANYIRQNKIKKPIIVGHSMGSIIAAAMAERYPDLIADKVIFLSPISVSPSKFVKTVSPLSALLPNKTVSFATTKYLFVPKKDKQLFKEALMYTEHCGEDYGKKPDILRAAKFSCGYSIRDFTFDDKKAYFIAGAKDRLVPRRKTEELAQDLHAEAVFIENAGHLLNYEAPEKVATAIKRFIKD